MKQIFHYFILFIILDCVLCKRYIINVDVENRHQQLNLLLLGNCSANPSSNTSLIATFYTCQPENAVRIRWWGSGIDPSMLKLEIMYKVRTMRIKNCE